mmetsp:Transcript_9988/g.15033  ORF Transcript_9988/g.15033 Transcript_9988/m.15033 type:complete len:214 (-) Transcript_9988:27-668(-)|eukprot:CAMPEP_0171466012 /NCGR_PEP_ID=MMETSP0945-20130129/8925_1 /TAXON_ID=109269 /ORGANISM="Vaucheria litorea, Strain CCMP2940" /LENGTH=213 /DNA_ID=CAMNT_0011993863 /DNA_START=55 /DNA_END=696 /DNA_ORIENTATION=+
MPYGNRKILLKVICIGNSGVGKTALMNRCVHKKFTTNYRATIGADFLEKNTVVDGENVNVQIWDTAGQERFQSLGVAFYRGSDACVLVYDITDSNSFQQLEVWREEFLNQSNPPNRNIFPFICIGNKVDKESDRKVSRTLVEQWCQNAGPNPIPYFETSAKDGTEVEETFNEIIRLAMKHSLATAPDAFLPDMVNLAHHERYIRKKNETNSCC